MPFLSPPRIRRIATIGALAALACAGLGATSSSAASGVRANGSRSAPASGRPMGRPTAGAPQIGALFRTANGTPTSHQCSAGVISSPNGDLLVTAAHCVYDAEPEPGLVFVPQYDSGAMPYGTWNVSAVYVAKQWSANRNPDYDVAFAVVHRTGSDTPIQDVVGADDLAVNQSYTQSTTVIGYPSSSNAPIVCTNTTTQFSATQLRFDCGGYSSGTSGSPFLTHVDPQTGLGIVDGVIGGYQAGGNASDVSYSVHFDDSTEALYQQAVKASQ